MKHKEIREIIKSVLEETSFVTSPYPKTTTAEKLINTAVKDGYIEMSQGPSSMDAAIDIAKKWDSLSDEEKKIFRDDYYRAFLKKIGASRINETIDIGLPLGPGDLENNKQYFDSLNEKEQWKWVLANKDKIHTITIDEDMAGATLKGDEGDFRKGVYSKYHLTFKSGGGFNPIKYILGSVGIDVQNI